MKRTDTDGILDKCHCGGRAAFEDNENPKTVWAASLFRVVCTECPETTIWFLKMDLAMVAWNKMIRDLTNDNMKYSEKDGSK